MMVSEPTCSWREKDGVIYFSVTSDGTTGEDWITRLESKGVRVGDLAKPLLCSPDFRATNDKTTVIAILKGSFFENDDRITKKICAEAKKRGLKQPHIETACLIREKLTDEDLRAMWLGWIVAMHKPIEDFGCHPYLLLGMDRGGGGDTSWFGAYGRPNGMWAQSGGFAFAMSF